MRLKITFMIKGLKLSIYCDYARMLGNWDTIACYSMEDHHGECCTSNTVLKEKVEKFDAIEVEVLDGFSVFHTLKFERSGKSMDLVEGNYHLMEDRHITTAAIAKECERTGRYYQFI
jgi:hypothetical protein